MGFEVRICVNGKSKHLGIYYSMKEAKQVYDDAAKFIIEDDIYYERRKSKKQLMITIFIYDKDDECIREHKKNFANLDNRRWFNGMLNWAMKNNFTIEIVRYAK